MLTSMYTAVSGMNANGTSLSVISDNIANLNTVGFKSSRAEFGDVLSQSMTGIAGSSQIGRGVQVMGVSPLFTQGSFESTASGLDLAIDGDGFFMVNDAAGARYYTRAGQFSIDKSGNIVNLDDLALQGYLADAAGNITGTTGNLQVATRQSPANMTTTAQVALNLDATATIPAAAFTLDANGDGINNDPANFNSSTTVNVYDSQGGAHPVTLYFVKTAANTWNVHYVHDNPAVPGSLVDAGTQNLIFNADGSLNTDNSGAAISFNFGGAVTNPQPIGFNFGTGTAEAPAGTGLDMSTQFASAFSVLSLNQDGYASGSLKSLAVSESGVITGSFTNGQTRAIGQVALARFIAPTGLSKLGRNLYGEAFDSGQPVVGAANTSGIGKIASNSLELSNVDLAQEFVDMIAA
ncbi:MAG: flagellar hook protein FlgE, partial [Nitrospirae bacterium]|nr:flagellar hook protein FlgE [Nitrospirota bacterium]